MFGVNLLSTTYPPHGRNFSIPDKECRTRSVNLLFQYGSVYPVYERKIYSLKNKISASCIGFKKRLLKIMIMVLIFLVYFFPLILKF